MSKRTQKGNNKTANIDSVIWSCFLPEDFLKHRILGLSAGHMKSNTAMLTATQASDTKLKGNEGRRAEMIWL